MLLIKNSYFLKITCDTIIKLDIYLLSASIALLTLILLYLLIPFISQLDLFLFTTIQIDQIRDT